ncbi:MAG: HAD-IIB family hydrolase [Lachnospiraceae bacterium]|nr:HAD-IIB family hydrolase [Lachnospiraceae bacterium]
MREMRDRMIKLVAFDLDGTLTQHRTPVPPENLALLDRIREKYRMLMVGAGDCRRIFRQMDKYPTDIIGNYGMQYCRYDAAVQDLVTVYDEHFPVDRKSVDERVTYLRERYGYTQYAGENVEFHESGCITIPLLGTKADIRDKVAFDPDRTKRRKIYAEVCSLFPEYNVFVGGSSSFDMTPRPYDKKYALDRFCKEEGIDPACVAYVGDDYGPGGNDEAVYRSDYRFICIDDYRRAGEALASLLECCGGQKEGKMIRLAAHRGYMSDYPENTMLAFRKALLEDIDQIETDVHMTKDGVLMLMHDHTVDRTTDGTGLIREKTYDQMEALDAGIKKDARFAGEKVPTLRQLFELIREYPGKEINIELKDYPCLSGEFAFRSCDKVIAMVEEFGLADRIYLNSFAGDILEYIDKTYGHKKYRLHGFYPPFVMNGTFDEQTIYDTMFCACLVNQEIGRDGKKARRADPLYPLSYFRAVRRLGPEIWVHFNEDTESLMRACIENGAAAFTSNDPHLAAAILKKIGAR